MVDGGWSSAPRRWSPVAKASRRRPGYSVRPAIRAAGPGAGCFFSPPLFNASKTAFFSSAGWRRRGRATSLNLLLVSGLLASPACQRDAASPPAGPAPAAASPAATCHADVVLAWLTVRSRLARTTPVTLANLWARPFDYGGIAGYEAVAPGRAGRASPAGRLNGLGGRPTAAQTLAYCWPLRANAALTTLN